MAMIQQCVHKRDIRMCYRLTGAGTQYLRELCKDLRAENMPHFVVVDEQGNPDPLGCQVALSVPIYRGHGEKTAILALPGDWVVRIDERLHVFSDDDFALSYNVIKW